MNWTTRKATVRHTIRRKRQQPDALHVSWSESKGASRRSWCPSYGQHRSATVQPHPQRVTRAEMKRGRAKEKRRRPGRDAPQNLWREAKAIAQTALTPEFPIDSVAPFPGCRKLSLSPPLLAPSKYR